MTFTVAGGPKATQIGGQTKGLHSMPQGLTNQWCPLRVPLGAKPSGSVKYLRGKTISGELPEHSSTSRRRDCLVVTFTVAGGPKATKIGSQTKGLHSMPQGLTILEAPPLTETALSWISLTIQSELRVALVLQLVILRPQSRERLN
jgi:hypothetical protein